MKLHYIQHVPYENAGTIETWAKQRGHTLTKTVLYYDEAFPAADDIDWLIVMGGPMNVYEDKEYTFLAREKKFIADAIAKKKRVLGVCLGAQLISDVLGGKVTTGPYKEIGWHTVTLTPEAKNSPAFVGLPPEFIAFQWHGDTFTIPPGAHRLASGEAFENQAFGYDGGRVVGLQFHLELTDDGIGRLAKNNSADLAPGRFVQKKDEFLHQDARLKENYRLLCTLLDGMATVTVK